MFALIKLVISVLYGILPNSPFRPYIDKLGGFNFLGYLNWVIPFDACVDITGAWVIGIFIYYNFDKIKKLIERIIDKIFD